MVILVYSQNELMFDTAETKVKTYTCEFGRNIHILDLTAYRQLNVSYCVQYVQVLVQSVIERKIYIMYQMGTESILQY